MLSNTQNIYFLYLVRYTLATIYAALEFAELIDGLIFTEGTEERIRYFANNGSATSVIGLALYDFIVTILHSLLIQSCS